MPDPRLWQRLGPRMRSKTMPTCAEDSTCRRLGPGLCKGPVQATYVLIGVYIFGPQPRTIPCADKPVQSSTAGSCKGGHRGPERGRMTPTLTAACAEDECNGATVRVSISSGFSPRLAWRLHRTSCILT